MGHVRPWTVDLPQRSALSSACSTRSSHSSPIFCRPPAARPIYAFITFPWGGYYVWFIVSIAGHQTKRRKFTWLWAEVTLLSISMSHLILSQKNEFTGRIYVFLSKRQRFLAGGVPHGLWSKWEVSAHSELLQTQVFHYVGVTHKGGEGLRGQLLKWTRTSSSAPTYGGPLVSLAKKTMPLHESPGLVVAPRSPLSTRGNHQKVRAASHRYPCAHPAAKHPPPAAGDAAAPMPCPQCSYEAIDSPLPMCLVALPQCHWCHQACCRLLLVIDVFCMQLVSPG